MHAADLDFALVFAGLREIVGELHAEPGLGRAAEGLRQPDGHLWANARLAVNDVVESLPADAENLGSLSDRQP